MRHARTGDGQPAPAEVRALVALSLVPGVGPGRIRALLSRFGTAEAVLAAPRRALGSVPGIGPQTAAAVTAFDGWDAVDDQLRRAERCGARLVAAWDDAFPALLRETYDPPAFLWLRGRLAASDARAVAVVGTRRATDYGRRVAHELAARLAERGFTVVSGLAYGIDAAAHRGALEAGGRTLAVLGSGVDRVYPARHAEMAARIVEQGALLSEYPLGAAPDAPNFPRRNRVVSGFALGTVVVEARETGGALITARMALEQNREVFAVPGPIHAPASAGCHALIQQGAKLVTGVDDVVAELGAAASADEPVQPAAGSPFADTSPVPRLASVPELNGIERRLMDVLEAEPTPIDVICARTELDASTALVYLLSLEFKGLVRQMAGKQFFRT